METRPSCEKEHDFALVLSGVSELTSEIMDALYEAGCDDATPSLRFGRLHLTFSRIAPTLKDAILSAIQDVRKTKIDGGSIRIDDCNLVTPSEIGRRIGRSRELVRQYITGKRGPGGFPPPTCQITDGKPLWAWCEVASWLRQNDMIREQDAIEANDVRLINLILECQREATLAPGVFDEFIEALGSMPSVQRNHS